MSTVARELIVLSSYTIHHFSLIAITLREPGLAVDPQLRGAALLKLWWQDGLRLKRSGTSGLEPNSPPSYWTSASSRPTLK